MAVTKVGGTNPIANLINRQIGNDLFNFREKLYRERLASVQCMYRRDLVFHYGCVNAIEFSADGELLVSGKKNIIFMHFPNEFALKQNEELFCPGLFNQTNLLNYCYKISCRKKFSATFCIYHPPSHTHTRTHTT